MSERLQRLLDAVKDLDGESSDTADITEKGSDYEKVVRCGNCGTEVAKGTKECPKCGYFLYGDDGKEHKDEKSTEAQSDEAEKEGLCPNCGASLAPTVKNCPVCKTIDAKKDMPYGDTDDSDSDSAVEQMSQPENMMRCPNCSALIPAESHQCPACGEHLSEYLVPNLNSTVPDHTACVACEASLDKSAKFCPACGTVVQEDTKKGLGWECPECGELVSSENLECSKGHHPPLPDMGELSDAVSRLQEREQRREEKAEGDSTQKFAKCPSCGTNVPLGTKKCPNCGATIPVGAQEPENVPPSSGGGTPTTAGIDNLDKIAYADDSPEKKAQQERSKKYGIGIKEDGNITKPSAWKDVPDDLFLDPTNYKFPVHDADHIRNASVRWSQYKSDYTDEEQRIIEKRLEKRKKALGIGEFRDDSKSDKNSTMSEQPKSVKATEEPAHEETAELKQLDENEVVNSESVEVVGSLSITAKTQTLLEALQQQLEDAQLKTSTLEKLKEILENSVFQEKTREGVDNLQTQETFDDFLVRATEELVELQKKKKKDRLSQEDSHRVAGIHYLALGLGYSGCRPTDLDDPDNDGDADMPTDTDAAAATAATPTSTASNSDVLTKADEEEVTKASAGDSSGPDFDEDDCPFCGADIDDDDKYCPNCGKKLPAKKENKAASTVEDNADEKKNQLDALLSETREELERVNSEYEKAIAELQSTKDAIKDRTAILNRQDDEIISKSDKIDQLNISVQEKHKELATISEEIVAKTTERDTLVTEVEKAQNDLSTKQDEYERVKKEYQILMDKELPSPVIHRMKVREDPTSGKSAASFVTRTTRENLKNHQN